MASSESEGSWTDTVGAGLPPARTSPAGTPGAAPATRRILPRLGRVLLAVVFAVGLCLGTSGVGAVRAAAVLPGPTDGGRAIITESTTEEVAAGITQSHYERVDPEGRNRIDVLEVDLSRNTPSYLDTGKVAGVGTVSSMAEAEDADFAVNGDFFDINNSGAPLGNGVADGQARTSANAEYAPKSVMIDNDRLGKIADLILDGTISFGGEESELLGLNVQKMADGLAVYDERWGTFPLGRSLDGADGYAVALDADGAVTRTDVDLGGEVTIGAGERVVLARGSAAVDALRTLAVGDRVDIEVGASAEDLQMAVGGHYQVADGGQPIEEGEDPLITTMHPRTAVGFSADGATMYLVAVEGRTDASRGMTLPELGRLMIELGAENALNLDGGGSTTMVGRDPGDAAPSVINDPSDGQEREVSNGLGITSDASDGELAGIDLELPAGDGTDAVFPGLRRTITAQPHDAGGRPVDAPIDGWDSSDSDVLTVADGTVTGVSSGTATVRARSGDVEGTAAMRVVGDLVRIEASTQTVQLPKQGDVVELTLVGYDAEGFAAPIDPADITIEGADGIVEVGPGKEQPLAVKALVDEGTGRLKLTVQGHSAKVAFAVGQDTEMVTTFEEGAAAYDTDGARSTVSAEDAPGREDDSGVALSMDFSQDTATRTANLRPKDPMGSFELPGQPLTLSAWVKGDGEHQPMIYAQVNNGSEDMGTIYGERIEKSSEWQQVTFEVPAGHATPQAWYNIGFYETDAALTYKTTVVFDDIEVTYSPPVEAPAPPRWRDHAVADGCSTADRPQRIAVMSDAQFVGREPDSPLVEGARRTLREIAAEDPEAVYIVGDLVDEGRDEDFELARRILDEELGDIPWTYVPGNHEVMGEPIANFREHFGASHTHEDLDGTRIITLDSSSGRIGDDFEQVKMLRQQLDDAANDPAISGVLVMFHHPTEDFLPTKASQLSDRHEAAMLEQWFAEFRAHGKHIGVINGHVGAFHTRQTEGVIHHTNGNSGKNPHSTPDWGGWLGWTMLGVDPSVSGDAPATEWLQVQTRPHIEEDSLAITAPDAVAVGDTTEMSAAFTQDGTEMPVSWPMSRCWSGDGVHVGDAADAPDGTKAVIDPDTQAITFLPQESGEVTVELTVNGHSATHTFTVTGSTPTPSVTPSPDPTNEPSPTPSLSPTPSVSPAPSKTPAPSEEPAPTRAPEPTDSPEPGHPAPEDTPEPGEDPHRPGDPAPSPDPDGDPGLPPTGAASGAAGAGVAALFSMTLGWWCIRRR